MAHRLRYTVIRQGVHWCWSLFALVKCIIRRCVLLRLGKNRGGITVCNINMVQGAMKVVGNRYATPFIQPESLGRVGIADSSWHLFLISKVGPPPWYDRHGDYKKNTYKNRPNFKSFGFCRTMHRASVQSISWRLRPQLCWVGHSVSLQFVRSSVMCKVQWAVKASWQLVCCWIQGWFTWLGGAWGWVVKFLMWQLPVEDNRYRHTRCRPGYEAGWSRWCPLKVAC